MHSIMMKYELWLLKAYMQILWFITWKQHFSLFLQTQTYSFSIGKTSKKKRLKRNQKKNVSCAKKRLWKTVKCTAAASDVIYLLLMVSHFSVFWFLISWNYWTLKQFSSLIDSQAHKMWIIYSTIFFCLCVCTQHLLCLHPFLSFPHFLSSIFVFIERVYVQNIRVTPKNILALHIA